MRIVILGDTHMPRMAKSLPPRLIKELGTADRIIHTGDWQSLAVYDELQRFAPVDGVYGNADPPEIREQFGREKCFSFDGITVSLVHGDGKGKTTPIRALDTFREEQPDIILFGHSHIPYHENHDGIVLFNPGSPTDKRRQQESSFGILETADTGFTLRHIFYNSKI
ncbi:metallophosphoesterase [Bhargavaea ginsengi]|uniref:metallophosphoesterase family protein n=1 Tax=Bhargavaea ginsengi TaxID=426757 RepID=UPI00203B6AA5|nr:metallophosphoesterase family protein [Bhargavaea ginsengi]MCM3086442.1 metallophosphoesterase [Bhargavaea ginsengi]